MNRVAWFTCALLAVASARIYERCELARELHALGVEPDHISTWVCIAYHESRFDTAANNPHSGDHGIFQISELYWCGPGKACGLPCSALRDEDISNDLECALLVHEEHTRLQGNGFLAWVVYPQHCKHNTKKYLVNCDTSVKNPVPITRTRAFNYENSYNQPNVTNNIQNIDDLLPPYLSIGSIFRGNYGKVLDQHKGRVDWYNYKIDNIDQLKLPVFNQPSQPMIMPPTSTPRSTTTVTTTTTTYIPPVKPWRTIETNQFRKKQLFSDKSTQEPTIKKDYTTEFEKYTLMTTQLTTASQLPTIVTTKSPPLIAKTTSSPNVVTTSTTYKPSTSTTLRTRLSTYSTTTQKPTTTTTAATTTITSRRKTTRRPTSTTTRRTTTTTTRRPTTTTRRTTLNTTTTGTTVRSNAVTRKPKTDFSWYTFTSRTSTTPATTKLQTVAPTRTTQPFAYSTKLQTDASPKTTQAVAYSTSTNKPQTTTQKPRSTQSIFDLYLNPTKPPKLPPYTYTWGLGSQTRLKIFASGTTTPSPVMQLAKQGRGEDSNGAAKNYIKRQT